VQELVTMLYQQAVQKNIKLLNLTSDLSVSLKSDATKFRHIMQNLISNAVKFTEKGSVEIQVKQIKDRVEFSVVDTGVGISEEHILHIFEEFRQADSSTSRRFGGTGLGLAIAKKYAQLLGGTISVSSKLGEGSTFTLSLPMVYLPNSNLPDAVIVKQFNQSIDIKPKKVEEGESGKTILLVEDSESAIIQMKDILEADGYTILVARDGAEGLAILSESIPDAIILDLMMPGVDGFEVLKAMRNTDETAHVPVLILSAKHLTSEDLTFLKRNNVHELIQKGDVNRIHLLEAVAKITNTQKEVIAPKKRAILPIDGKPVVLIVEDNPDNMITIKAVLEDGYTILEAVNGMEGIEMAEKHKPHLILMDIALPQLDGITAFKTIRNNPELQHIPVIAVTASAMNSERETILAQGLDGYISKPIDVIDFFETINEVLYGK
jgi:CheY-like chemotaxis protein/anti-sigma regulatory factor (Ser/Thr protein kinase)